LKSSERNFVFRTTFFDNNDGSFVIKHLTPWSKMTYLATPSDVVNSNRVTKEKLFHQLCKQTMKTENVVLYFPKNFYLIDAINEKIGIFKASGLMDYWIDNFVEKRFLHFNMSNNGPKQLNLDHFYGVFCIFLTGCSTAIFVFIMEILIIFVKNKKQNLTFERGLGLCA
jgi:hypothetical protein